MNKIKTLLTIVVFSILTTTVFAENKNDAKKASKSTDKIYLFGIGSAFGDSIVHFTSIIELEDISLEKKTKFLPYRITYSIQLKAYLEGTLGYSKQTCSIFFSKNKKKLSKKYYKLKKAYLEESGSSLNIIGSDKFTFTVPYTANSTEK